MAGCRKSSPRPRPGPKHPSAQGTAQGKGCPGGAWADQGQPSRWLPHKGAQGLAQGRTRHRTRAHKASQPGNLAKTCNCHQIHASPTLPRTILPTPVNHFSNPKKLLEHATVVQNMLPRRSSEPVCQTPKTMKTYNCHQIRASPKLP